MMTAVHKENALIYMEQRYQNVNAIVISDGLDQIAPKVRIHIYCFALFFFYIICLSFISHFHTIECFIALIRPLVIVKALAHIMTLITTKR